MKPKCYVLGAVTGIAQNAEEIFNTYKKSLERNFTILGTPLETAQFKGTLQERFQRAEQAIKNADVIIAEMSTASTGAGIEMGMAHNLGKPIYCFAKSGSKVSGLVVGMVGENNVKYYNDTRDLQNALQNCISLDQDRSIQGWKSQNGKRVF